MSSSPSERSADCCCSSSPRAGDARSRRPRYRRDVDPRVGRGGGGRGDERREPVRETRRSAAGASHSDSYPSSRPIRRAYDVRVDRHVPRRARAQPPKPGDADAGGLPTAPKSERADQGTSRTGVGTRQGPSVAGPETTSRCATYAPCARLSRPHELLGRFVPRMDGGRRRGRGARRRRHRRPL